MAAKVYGDRWQIEQEWGQGGQAHTFLVSDKTNDGGGRYVLKRLKNINRLERFRREAEVISSLSHPNVVRLIDHNLENEKPYLVMELCAGGSLDKSQGQWRTDPRAALRLFIETCEGVAAAHTAGVIHRDLKPDNVLLRASEGPAVVADFGLAYVEDGERHTLLDEAVGPRNFMCPEMEDGRATAVLPTCDVYSLGKLLYWLLSGGGVFSREKHREPRYNLVEHAGNPRMEAVNRLLDRMITSEPGRRLANAARVSEEAHQLLPLLEGRYNVPSSRVSQPCLYCGMGKYRFINDQDLAERDFGTVGKANWKILVCEKCGHTQLFRVDMADRRDWWD